MSLVYLDACAIIDAREKQSPEAQAIVNLIAEGAADETPFITSELTLLEVLVHLIRGLVDRSWTDEDPNARSDHDWYQANLSADSLLVKTVPMSRDIVVQAALMRARVTSLRTPDAIHAATAYQFGCTHFVTGDPRLSRSVERDPAWSRSSKRFKFVPLRVLELDALRAELRR